MGTRAGYGDQLVHAYTRSVLSSLLGDGASRLARMAR
jgi:hypothetical protein